MLDVPWPIGGIIVAFGDCIVVVGDIMLAFGDVIFVFGDVIFAIGGNIVVFGDTIGASCGLFVFVENYFSPAGEKFDTTVAILGSVDSQVTTSTRFTIARNADWIAAECARSSKELTFKSVQRIVKPRTNVSRSSEVDLAVAWRSK